MDYSYYQFEYKGAILDSDAFYSALPKAKAYISAITFGRADNSCDKRVLNAVCAVAEDMYESAASNISSETVGDLSITYANRTTEQDSRRRYDLARMFLANTGLLYRGR